MAVVIGTSLALGVAGGAVATYYGTLARRAPAVVAGAPGSMLWTGTREALRSLRGPVNVRYYAILDPGLPEGVRTVAGHADRLLAAFESESGGKVKVSRTDTRLEADLQAAAAAGLRPFNLDRGEACYLGLALAGEHAKELLTPLTPEWEPALEFDLARAVVRVANAQPTAPAAPAANPAELAAAATAAEEVRQSLTNLAAISVEEATRRLREAAFKEFRTATEEMQARVAEIEQRAKLVQAGGSEADRQAVAAELRQAQAEGMERLKEVAARLQDRIDAVERIKGVPPAGTNTAKRAGRRN
jgi:predicted RNA-binding Zn ribbon-like protein